jgi:hypothetical protein
MIQSIGELLALFGETDVIGARALQIPASSFRNWRATRKIGRENWDFLIAQAAARGVTIDANWLHRMCLHSGQEGIKRGRRRTKPLPPPLPVLGAHPPP